jgi:hypothetical protein
MTLQLCQRLDMHRFLATSILLTLLAFLALPGKAAAWHENGHYAIARLAWQQLDDKQKVDILKILKAHPHYDIYLKAECPKELSEGEWAFLRAATWSDWVRSPRAPGLGKVDADAIRVTYNKGVWHYVDLPLIHPADKGKFDEPSIRKEILEPEFDAKGEPRHALAAIKLALKTLSAADTPDKDKAIYLCWLSHITGDIHQPLHCTSLIASKATYGTYPFDPPEGDRGGNLVAVRRQASDSEAVNMHFLWDALVFRGQSGYSSVEAMVAKLRSDPQLQRDRLPELKATDTLAWVEEGLALVKDVVYRGDKGFLEMAAFAAQAKVKAEDAPVLPAGYEQRAEEVARRRMVIAGYRFADQLGSVFKAGK